MPRLTQVMHTEHGLKGRTEEGTLVPLSAPVPQILLLEEDINSRAKSTPESRRAWLNTVLQGYIRDAGEDVFFK